MNQNNDPSPFYMLFNGAKDFVLLFSSDEDGCGPFWHENGELDLSRSNDQFDDEVALVELGADQYRLVCRYLEPLSGLRLHWGDEFVAERMTNNELILKRIVVPQKFKHYQFIASASFNNDNPIAQIVHRHGGGWGAVAGGILTLTVPAHTAANFEREMEEKKLIPGIFRLEV
jgi:hypothetical protein